MSHFIFVYCVLLYGSHIHKRIYPRLNVPLEIWSRKLKTRSRSTFDRVTAISTLAFKEEINKGKEMGKIKWDLFAKFVLCVPNQVQRLTLVGMEPGTPLSPQEIPGPRSSCLISPLKKNKLTKVACCVGCLCLRNWYWSIRYESICKATCGSLDVLDKCIN